MSADFADVSADNMGSGTPVGHSWSGPPFQNAAVMMQQGNHVRFGRSTAGHQLTRRLWLEGHAGGVAGVHDRINVWHLHTSGTRLSSRPRVAGPSLPIKGPAPCLTSPGNVRMMSNRMSRFRGRRAHRRMSPALQEAMLCWCGDLRLAGGAVHGRQGASAELLK